MESVGGSNTSTSFSALLAAVAAAAACPKKAITRMRGQVLKGMMFGRPCIKPNRRVWGGVNTVEVNETV